MNQSALLLVDLQALFTAPNSPARLAGWPAAKIGCLQLLATARKLGRPVLWTRHVHPPDDRDSAIEHFFGRLITSQDPLSEIGPDCRPEQDEPVIEKARHSAFWNTDLQERLRNQGVDTLVIAGVQTALCVLATAADANSRDIVPVVVADACAAKRIEEHDAAVTALASGLAHVTDTAEIVTAWNNQNHPALARIESQKEHT